MNADDKPAASKDTAGQEFLSRWSRLKAEAKDKPVESDALQAEGDGAATRRYGPATNVAATGRHDG